eukprot:CAMPEP_0194155212 /NCGR_PEP_ID=MMETSP0152-20130528/63582_1 /TAXON_ID=1049557 /ORGANISM="Thalassiothrix antarctica, Strain L6-D1" /LENGTH=1007 /DNA_ID=CAMNT_0038861871 /DNA_START=102 /DNA_END=3125 /DNA_ORIENTATION=+
MSFDQVKQALLSTNELFQDKAFPRQGLEFADFMVHRLGAEYASGSTIAQQFTDEVYFLHCFLLSAYHEELPLNNPDPQKLERVERLLRRLASLYFYLDNDDPGVETPPPVGVIETLVESWLKLNNENKAVGLLIWWTDESQENEVELSPLFRKTLMHCFSAENEKLSRILLEQMKRLKSDFGWNSFKESKASIENDRIVVNNKELISSDKKISDGELIESTFAEPSKEIEIGIVTEKIVDFINNAGFHDEKKINIYLGKLLSVPGSQINEGISEALVDYFVRVEKIKEAFLWLQRLDKESVSGNIIDKFEGVLQLIENDPTEYHSSMRSMEIFQRMEFLESEGRGTISLDACNRICRILKKTKDLNAKEKIKEILDRIFCLTYKNSDRKLPNEDSFDLLLADVSCRSELHEALKCLASNWSDNMDTECRGNVAGKFISELAKYGMVTEAQTLMALCLKTDIRLQNSIIEDYLITHLQSFNPNQVFDGIDYLEKKIGILPFDCYANIIFQFPCYGLIDKEKELSLLKSILSLILHDKLTVSNKEGRHFLEEVTNNLRLQGKHSEGEKVISFLEDGGASETTNLQLLSVKSFNNTMMACMEANEFRIVESLFNRLFGYYKAGNTCLMPDSSSHNIYLNMISRQPRSGSKAEDVLKEFLNLYKSVQLEDLKPDESHFISVLTALQREFPPDLMSRSLTIIDQMKKLNILSATFMSGSVMKSILQSGSNKMNDTEKSRLRTIMAELEIEPAEIDILVPTNAAFRKERNIEDRAPKGLNSGIKICKYLPMRYYDQEIPDQDFRVGVNSLIRMMKIMSNNDDIEVPLNKLRHQLKLSHAKNYENRNVGDYWISEAFKAGKISAFQRDKGKEFRICLRENIESATAPYTAGNIDTLKEEEHLIAFVEANGGCVLRTEAIKYLVEEFESMQGPFQRTKVLMNAYKRGTLYLRKSTYAHVIGVTPEQADTEIANYRNTSYIQSDSFCQPLQNPNQIINFMDESFLERNLIDQEVAI